MKNLQINTDEIAGVARNWCYAAHIDTRSMDRTVKALEDLATALENLSAARSLDQDDIHNKYDDWFKGGAARQLPRELATTYTVRILAEALGKDTLLGLIERRLSTQAPKLED